MKAGAVAFTLKAVGIAAIFFVGVLPTLNWLEFSGGSENLVVETVLEMHRGGPWLIPTLKGAPRTAKPPLTAWIGAAAVNSADVATLSDRDQRGSAYRKLAFKLRWPALLSACLTLVAAAWLGRVFFDDKTGLTTAAIMGGTLLFLRFGRGLTTDVQLGLWTCIANAFLALAVVRDRRWLGYIGGGVACGLALMSKGPPALAQTVAPLVVTIAWMRWKKITPNQKRAFAPVIAFIFILIAIAAPWPIWVLSRHSGQVRFWINELTHAGAETFSSDPMTTYLSLIPLLLPWAGFFFLGFVCLARQKSGSAVYVMLLVLTPIIIMTCFKEKNERYLLPMLAPCAVISAVGLVRRNDGLQPIRNWVTAFTWGVLAVIAVGLPIAGVVALHRVNGAQWWSAGLAVAAAGGGLICLAAAWWADRSHERFLVPASMVIMIGTQALFMHGYADSTAGRSDGKPLADAIAETLPPDAEVRVFTSPGRFTRMPVDTTIYLNRLTAQTSNPTTLPATNVPRAILIHQRNEATLPPELEGWRAIRSVKKNAGIWSACTQPAN